MTLAPDHRELDSGKSPSYRKLIEEIVLSAVEDWVAIKERSPYSSKSSRQTKVRGLRIKTEHDHKREVERLTMFFQSDWFEGLLVVYNSSVSALRIRQQLGIPEVRRKALYDLAEEAQIEMQQMANKKRIIGSAVSPKFSSRAEGEK